MVNPNIMFRLKSPFIPTGDQPQAIKKLTAGVNAGYKNQVLLGVTGSGKTFTMANIIRDLNMPTLIISHNKTLAGQLYQEMRDFFPDNGISYFVSYYDFYQPEAYIPTTDTYIEKEAEINQLIDKLRLQSTTNILTRNDVIVVASVSCIYNIGSPQEYGRSILSLKVGETTAVLNISRKLAELQYERSEFEFRRGTFRIRGRYIDVYPAYEDIGYRIEINNNLVKLIIKFDPLTGVEDKSEIRNSKLETNSKSKISNGLNDLVIYPAKHFMTDPSVFQSAEKQIRHDLKIESQELKNLHKIVEAERLIRRVNYDLEMIKEVGYINGIENYSRYFDGRRPGDPPYSLLNYFQQAYGDNWLLFIDESHMTVPQLRGMYNGDFSRKKTLIDFGFRLKAAFDNRPLKFDEFYQVPKHIIYFSATPDEWELSMSKTNTGYDAIAEQLIRPTGIVDPQIMIKPAKQEVLDLMGEIQKRVEKNQKVLVTTLTKKTAEDLTEYLKEKNIRASYLHSDIQTLERSDVLDNLRKNEFDVLIGVNLLREGLDLPEVTLVAILDADREGFLRSRTSLVQTMGRAARNISGEIILYADVVTQSMKSATEEINRRRKYQEDYNRKHHISPTNIDKPIRKRIAENEELEAAWNLANKSNTQPIAEYIDKIRVDTLTPYDKKKMVKKLEREMKKQADDMNFEMAIRIREKVKELTN